MPCGCPPSWGTWNIPDGVLVDINHIKSLPRNKICIITTGSQGEAMSALFRIAFSTHKQVDIQAGDRVIISASAIPGNENAVNNIINELYRKKAEVVSENAGALHVSGHACQDELKIIHALVRPKFFIPVHGEQRHLQTHARVAQEMGIPPGEHYHRRRGAHHRTHPPLRPVGRHGSLGPGLCGRVRRGRRGQRGPAGPPAPGPGRHDCGGSLPVRRGPESWSPAPTSSPGASSM